ncbi:hypothetical protein JXB27_02245 [Candidatus Woesearchaeota archaeon]|nr:hypothetical protein [Candidatus Woesearchaeota archaeon]
MSVFEALKERGKNIMGKLNYQSDTEEIAKLKRYYKRTGDVDFEIGLLKEYITELEKMLPEDKRESNYITEATQVAFNLANKFPFIVPDKTMYDFGRLFFRKYGENELVVRLFEEYGSALRNEISSIARSKRRMNLAEAKLENFEETRQKLQPTFKKPLEEMVGV